MELYSTDQENDGNRTIQSTLKTRKEEFLSLAEAGVSDLPSLKSGDSLSCVAAGGVTHLPPSSDGIPGESVAQRGGPR